MYMPLQTGVVSVFRRVCFQTPSSPVAVHHAVILSSPEQCTV